ncbi:epoxide hydrolase family protein [Kineosporia succinea]|uniref:Microsomal epoxide hydrolase n=1 Tax=Kineosporia succinea TaxID=84632 RepID=A0ABT9PBW8_9ACTN|nr:epoxide hydrolase family protein [Kineosporia succinea]MDP9829665.1 microsomal epoxide hydrolase [Kineosporia succinea]
MNPFRIDIDRSEIEDLRARIRATRWPAPGPSTDWSRGVPTPYLQELAAYWADTFDWYEAQDEINRISQSLVGLDGLDVHVLHARSPEPDATPLILTHGWPSSFVEYLDVIGPLSDPRAHGGDPADAFHVVVPSLPGFGFSGPQPEYGWTLPRIAGMWASLMHQLGYERYIAQGGDIGAWVTQTLAVMDAPHVAGAHLNFLITPPPPGDPAALAGLTEQEGARLGLLQRFADDGVGYMALQASRPQTLAHSLSDSPVGQLAWIIEKFHDWADTEKLPEDAISRDRLLMNASVYWLTRSGGTSANLYYDNRDVMPSAATPPPLPPPVPVPSGVSVYPGDAALPVRRFAEPMLPNIVQWTEHDRGGHFPALEEPDLFVEDIRSFARTISQR